MTALEQALADFIGARFTDSPSVTFAYDSEDGTVSATAETADGGSDGSVAILVSVTDEWTPIGSGSGAFTFRMPFAMTVNEVRASVGTASSSGAIQVDINESGASILSTKLTIDQGEKTSETAATAAVISDDSLADDAEIVIDIDNAGTGATGLKVALIGVRSGIGGGVGSGDTAPSNLYVNASTGNDSTGDGTSGTPYATVGKALSVLPAVLEIDHTIHVADGTYTEAINLTGFISKPNTILKITGNTTTPANVSFTGTASDTQRGKTYSSTVLIGGSVNIELEGIRINAAADNGVWIYNGARCVMDRCTVTGTLTNGVMVWNQAYLELQGNITISGWSERGLQVNFSSIATYTAAGTLTITGPGTSISWGVNVADQSSFGIYWFNPSGINITITEVQIGFQIGLCSLFTHQAASGTITVDNASTPSSSAAIQCTDCSTWSTNQAAVFDHFTYGIQALALAYGEAVGSRTWTNLSSNSNTGQGSQVYLP